MTNWTDAEKRALHRTAHIPGIEGYRTFRAIAPESERSFDSWEVKRRRIDLAFVEPSPRRNLLARIWAGFWH